MATTAARITVPGRTRVYLAPVGTAAPETATALMSATPLWIEVGFTTEDSLNFSTEPEFVDIRSAQADLPTRTIQTTENATLSVDLQEWSKASFISAYGGGTVEPILNGLGTPTGSFKFVPPTLGNREEKACIVEVVDGTKVYRYVFPRVLQREGVAQDLQRGGEAKLPLRLALQGGGDSAAWYMITNDSAAFA